MIKSLCSALLLLSTPLMAKEDGKTIYTTKLCVTCHGIDGKPTAPIYPTIFGKDKDCMAKEYQAIMAGQRQGMAATMKAMLATQKLSEAQVKAVLEWVASQKAVAGAKDPATVKCKIKTK